MNDKQSTVFRKQTLDRVNSPDQLTDYLRVTSPGIWVILIAVILLLAGLFAWSAIGTLETTSEARVVVENNTAQVISIDGTTISQGMPLRVLSQEYVIASAKKDEYGRSVGIAAVTLPDGIYDGLVVTETVHPIGFLLESR